MIESFIGAEKAEQLLQEFACWGNMTTIIIHAGSVFEFKGAFPSGTNAEGFYNLKGHGSGASAGFEGHLNLSKVSKIALIEKQHRGRDSFAFAFLDAAEQVIFKVFLGRLDSGEIIPQQLEKFKIWQQS